MDINALSSQQLSSLTSSLMLSSAQINTYKQTANALSTLTLTQRQVCDLELLLNGGFAPLTGFMTRVDYDSVLNEMRLSDGTIWPIPIALDVNKTFLDSIKIGDEIALRDAEGLLLAIMTVSDSWLVDREREALSVFGTTDTTHPGVFYLQKQTQEYYIGGEVRGIALPHHYDFRYLRFTPAELKDKFNKLGWKKIVGFQTRNPMHRAHQELTLRAAQKTGANLLLHPVVGMTKPGDIEYYTRVRCYEHVLKTYPDNIER